MYYTLRVCYCLIIRAVKHDLSKFSKEEFEYIYILSTRGKDIKFGSKEYYDLVDCVLPAKRAHFTRNRHHIEFHENINKMSILDKVEMLADWFAATKNKHGNIYKSLEINQTKYNIEDGVKQSILHSISEIDGK